MLVAVFGFRKLLADSGSQSMWFQQLQSMRVLGRLSLTCLPSMDFPAILHQLFFHSHHWVCAQPVCTISHKNSLYSTSSEWRHLEGTHDNLLKN